MSLLLPPIRLLRLILVALALLGLQKTVFIDLRPLGVVIQVVLAFAAAAGAAAGPEQGAVVGFVVGLMFDLTVGAPLGASAISMTLAGFVAGWVDVIRIDTTWWLAAIFVGVGAAIGEASVPLVRSFTGHEDALPGGLLVVVPVVAVAAATLSVVFVPLARWVLGIGPPEWKVPTDA